MTQHLKFGCFSKVNAVELLKADVSLKGYKALMALHALADEHGRVFASQSEISKRFNIDKAFLSRGLVELKRKGFVFHVDEKFYRIDPILIRYSSKEQYA
jgi:DNA-binding IclR family transcriptional regulator